MQRLCSKTKHPAVLKGLERDKGKCGGAKKIALKVMIHDTSYILSNAGPLPL